MAKDARYKAVKSVIESGAVKTLQEIFLYIPKKTVYTDLGMNYVRFTKLVSSPELFTVQELYEISLLIDVSHRTVIDLTLAQIEKKGKGRKSGKG
jgi:hypothetical protein